MTDPFYKAHWRDIDAERMSGYRAGFGWDAAAEELYAPADIRAGHLVADFGCGPGKVALALAGQVGPEGHVHALDINEAFLDMVVRGAREAGLSDRVTAHPSDGAALPLADGALDRVSARNTLMYVDDAVATLQEFRRVLRPGGLAHAIDGDWHMMVAEPVDRAEWRDFVDAAAHACRHADMGRRLHGAFVAAGFADVRVQVVARADTEGRLLGMVRNMARYATDGGRMAGSRAASIVDGLDRALAEGTYLAVSPQFVVTGSRPG